MKRFVIEKSTLLHLRIIQRLVARAPSLILRIGVPYTKRKAHGCRERLPELVQETLKSIGNHCKLLHMKSQPNKPRRLERIFQSYDAPVYFITFSTYDRKPILAKEAVHQKLISFAQQAESKGVAFGLYIIMPDHIHCFVRIAPDQRLGTTMRLLKRALSSVIEAPKPHWQPGFFDHVLRHSESYSEKWNYVLQNPVRAGLVEDPEEWPFQGDIVPIRY